MNDEVAEWIAGRGRKPGWLGRGDGPIWSRLYSDGASDASPHCGELQTLLRSLSPTDGGVGGSGGAAAIERMVVGHTVRKGGISSLCNGQVWRIDVGLSRTESRAGSIGASEVLEITQGGNEVKVLSTDTKLNTWT